MYEILTSKTKFDTIRRCSYSTKQQVLPSMKLAVSRTGNLKLNWISAGIVFRMSRIQHARKHYPRIFFYTETLRYHSEIAPQKTFREENLNH